MHLLRRSHHLRRRAGLSDFSKRVDVLKGALDAYNQKAQNLFALPGTTSLRLWLLWADAVRQNIRYPMDKAADTARFQETFVADAIVGYVREAGAAQKELAATPASANSRCRYRARRKP